METAEEQAVWGALGDPTRRRLLGRLREGPRTTGDLCEGFEMSRYGVMKHLNVLTAAGLVTVQREGRHRYNHLNAVPLERIRRRFVRDFAMGSAANLLNLDAHLQSALGTEPTPTQNQGNLAMSDNTNHSFHIVQEIELNAPTETVWSSLTRDIGKWWGFHVGPNDSSITLDGRVGGQFIERWGDGEGELYATVTYLKKGSKITLEGGMGMSGPGFSKFSFTLEGSGDKTQLTLNHYCHGHRTEDVEASFSEGWTALLSHNLKAWVEEGIVAQPA